MEILIWVGWQDGIKKMTECGIEEAYVGPSILLSLLFYIVLHGHRLDSVELHP